MLYFTIKMGQNFLESVLQRGRDSFTWLLQANIPRKKSRMEGHRTLYVHSSCAEILGVYQTTVLQTVGKLYPDDYRALKVKFLYDSACTQEYKQCAFHHLSQLCLGQILQGICSILVEDGGNAVLGSCDSGLPIRVRPCSRLPVPSDVCPSPLASESASSSDPWTAPMFLQ